MNAKIIVILTCMLFIATTMPLTNAINAEGGQANPLSDDEEWPMFCHDSSLNGFSPCTIVNENTIWEYETTGIYVYDSCATIKNDRLYIGAMFSDWSGCVICLDANTGNHIWTSDPLGDIIYSTPAVYQGNVYVGDGEGRFICLDESTGDVNWDYYSGDWISSSPNCFDGKVYFCSYDSYVYCLDAFNGDFIWKFKTGRLVSTSPAISDGKVFIGAPDKHVYCLDAYTGGEIWSKQLCTGEFENIYHSPTIVDGKLYVGVSKGYLYCLDPANGDEIWHSDVEIDQSYSSPTIAYGKVYVGGDNGLLYCLNEENGQQIWTYDTNDDRPFQYFNGDVSSPAVADGSVYIHSGYTGGARLYRLDAETGEELWLRKIVKDVGHGATSAPSPTIANGKIYFGAAPYNHDNPQCYSKIYCFGSGGIDKSIAIEKHNLEHIIEKFPLLHRLLSIQVFENIF
jgi:outer membrane protein assembly factor BamB